MHTLRQIGEVMSLSRTEPWCSGQRRCFPKERVRVGVAEITGSPPPGGILPTGAAFAVLGRNSWGCWGLAPFP